MRKPGFGIAPSGRIRRAMGAPLASTGLAPVATDVSHLHRPGCPGAGTGFRSGCGAALLHVCSPNRVGALPRRVRSRSATNAVTRQGERESQCTANSEHSSEARLNRER